MDCEFIGHLHERVEKTVDEINDGLKACTKRKRKKKKKKRKKKKKKKKKGYKRRREEK